MTDLSGYDPPIDPDDPLAEADLIDFCVIKYDTVDETVHIKLAEDYENRPWIIRLDMLVDLKNKIDEIYKVEAAIGEDTDDNDIK